MKEFYKLKDQKKQKEIVEIAFSKGFFEAHTSAGSYLVEIGDPGREYIRTTLGHFECLLERIRKNSASNAELTKKLPPLTDLELIQTLGLGEEEFPKEEMMVILDLIYSVEEYPGMFECLYLFYQEFKGSEAGEWN